MIHHIRAVGIAVTSLVAVAAALPASAQTFSDEAGNALEFYGQLSGAFLSFDDGVSTDQHLGNNGNSTSRLGFTLDHDAGVGQLRFRFETALGLATTSDFSQNDTPEALDWDRTELRKVELSLDTRYGKVSAGQGSMASDGAGEVDDSGTSMAAYAAIDDLVGGYRLRDSDGNLTEQTMGDVFFDTDGARRLRVRYDTPTVGGVTVAFAYGKEVLAEDDDDTYYDTALNWQYDFGTFEIKTAVGVAWTDFEDDKGRQGQNVASVSITHQSGLSVNVGTGHIYSDGGDWSYAKLGYTGDWIEAGQTRVAVEYYHSSGFGTESMSARIVGLMAVQKLDALDTDLFAGVRRYEANDDTRSYKTADSVMVGARWSF